MNAYVINEDNVPIYNHYVSLQGKRLQTDSKNENHSYNTTNV